MLLATGYEWLSVYRVGTIEETDFDFCQRHTASGGSLLLSVAFAALPTSLPVATAAAAAARRLAERRFQGAPAQTNPKLDHCRPLGELASQLVGWLVHCRLLPLSGNSLLLSGSQTLCVLFR